MVKKYFHLCLKMNIRMTIGHYKILETRHKQFQNPSFPNPLYLIKPKMKMISKQLQITIALYTLLYFENVT